MSVPRRPVTGPLKDTLGAVLSKLIVTLTDAEFSPLSTASPVKLWSAPSVVTTTGSLQLATPLSPSWQSNVTVTSALCQPFAFAGLLNITVLVGGVTSS